MEEYTNDDIKALLIMLAETDPSNAKERDTISKAMDAVRRLVPPTGQEYIGRCPVCGTPVTIVANFCYKCGQKLPEWKLGW